MHSGSQARHVFRSSHMSVDAKLSWNWAQMENPVLRSLLAHQGFALTSLKLTCSALVFSLPSTCTYRDHLATRQTIQTDRRGFTLMSWEKKPTSLNPEDRDWALAGRQITARSICVVLVFWSDSLFMWRFSSNACFLYPSAPRWCYAAGQQNKLLCLVVEKSFPSTYYSLLRWVAKNGVFILMKIDSQREYAACLASLLDAQQRAWQTLNNGIACWFGD